MPKNKKYYIWTIGCQMNKSDSERMAAVLESLNFVSCCNEEEADVIIVNTCSVRQTAEDRVYGKIRALRRLKKENKNLKIVLAGCMPQRKGVKEKLESTVDAFLEMGDLSRLAEIVGQKPIDDHKEYFKVLPTYQSPFQAYVPIMTGCENFCSYCVVPYVRGPEKSRSCSGVIEEVRGLVDNGYKEITLLGQNVNSYQYGFVKLLKDICKIKGDFWIRFISLHPKDMTEELINIVAQEQKICEYIHLPFQAGDNTILKKMNRKYTRADYLGLINKIRKAIPEVALSTDVIVGFPGETKEQFNKSVEVFKKAKFDMAYINKYSTRAGTKAAEFIDNVSQAEKKRREQELTKILIKTAAKNNEKYIDKTWPVLVEKETPDKDINYYLGKTRTFKNVKFTGPKGLLGQFVNVKITKALDWGLKGELVDSQ